jgi:hypothetical protein
LRQDFTTPSAFLTSLPKLAGHFAVSEEPWPRFSEAPAEVQNEEHREEHRPDSLLDGVASALEVSCCVRVSLL